MPKWTFYLINWCFVSFSLSGVCGDIYNSFWNPSFTIFLGFNFLDGLLINKDSINHVIVWTVARDYIKGLIEKSYVIFQTEK